MIVSALDPTDPSSVNSVEALKRPEKIISELVITELSSVLSRNNNFMNLVEELSGDRASTLYATIIYILQKFDLLFIPLQQANFETPIGNYGNIMSFAIELTKDVPLRTQDLLHLSYAHAITESTKSSIEFMNRDKEFDVFKTEIFEATGITVAFLT